MICGLSITEVNVSPVKETADGSPLLGFARIVLNGAFMISGIRLIRTKDGVFISFPREYSKKDSKAYDIAHPIRKDLHEEILKRVLEAYTEVIKT